ncbi:MAG: acyl-CoA dehydrogenase family protein [Actinomycetota bacterium]|nr:acyl-CoA dehydrogenase family protein [Actinomycetota bacterium]
MTATARTTSFSPAALQRLLDGPYAKLRELVRERLARPEFAPMIALPSPEYREWVFERAKALAAEGGTALGFPVEYGGAGNPGANVASFETLALGDLSLLVKVGVQFGLWGGVVQQLGTKPHHDRYLADIATLALPGCFAMTETGHGSNVQALGTTATYDAATGEFVVDTPAEDARKEYIGNAACHGRLAAVFAQLIVGEESHGVHALVVPLRDEHGNVCDGVRIEDSGEKMGLGGVDNGRIWFDSVRVPRDALLNRYGDVSADGRYTSPIDSANKRFFTMLGALVQGRVSISSASVTTAKTALTIAVRYGLRRRQFGPPGGDEVAILDYRTHQRRLMPALAKTYALHFAQQELTSKFHAVFSGGAEESDPAAAGVSGVDPPAGAGPAASGFDLPATSQAQPDGMPQAADAPDRDRRELESLAAAMKATTSWHAVHTIQTSRECCGGAGYMAVNRFAALRADVDIFTTFEGDNTVLMMLAAKGLLTNYADHLGDLNPVGLVTFVASQVVDTVLERLFARKLAQVISDAVPSGDETRNLLDRDYQLDLFQWREGHIVASVANRFKRGLAEGFDPFEVFRAVQDHAINAARAHTDRLILEAFIRAIDGCQDDALAGLLNRLCDLYALSNVEEDRGFFEEHGRLSSARCKAITREVNRLCDEVRGEAGGLVDAFGIPDAVLAAPIGLKGAE